MRRYIIFCLLLCIGGNGYAQTLIDSIIAVVNTDAITRSELENEFRIAAIIGEPFVAAPTAAQQRAVLEKIINRKFVLQESERIGVVVPERDVQIEGKVTEIRARYAAAADFQNVLQQYQVELETLKMWTYEQLIYDEFFRRRFFNAINSAEVEKLAKSYYDENLDEFVEPPTVTFTSLLIAVPTDISEAEKQNVADLIKQLTADLQQGKTYEAVRKTYETQLTLKLSESTIAADTKLGRIVIDLKTAQRSQPIPVSEGYQIVQRVRNEPAYQQTYAEVSDQVTERIRQEEATQRFKAWLTTQKAEKTWHILDGELTRTENEVK